MIPATPSVDVTKNAAEALKHFATAFVFLVLGLATLVANSDLLATGAARTSPVVAGLHFITLGWLSLSIFGALQVFTGVALGGVQLNRHYAPWGRRVWTLALLLFVGGLYEQNQFAVGGGVALLGVALVLYTVQMIPALLQAKQGQITRIFTAIAFFCLWCVWILGSLAGLARAGWVPALTILPPGYLQTHILLAVFGWVGSMIIGVGSHLIPMFALSRNTSQFFLKSALMFWLVLPLVGLVSAYYPNPWIKISWGVAAIGSICWAIQFVLYFRNRVRRERDYGLMITALATAFMLAAWVQAGSVTDPVPFIALALLGWLSFFTLGIYHRVLPFLVWFMKYARPQKGLPPPKVKDLIDPGVSVLVMSVFGVGIVLWMSGLNLHLVTAVRCGAVLMLLGSLCSLGHLKTLRGGAPLSLTVVNRFKAIIL